MANLINKLSVIGASLLLSCASLTAATTQDVEALKVSSKSFKSWKRLHSTSGKCRISFPEEPEHMQQSMVLPEEQMELKYDVYVAGLEQKAVFMVLIAEYPTVINQSYAQLSLENFLSGILTQNPYNRLIFADLVTVQGHKGLDFFIRTKDVYFKGRAIMANNQLYLLAMECEVQNYQESDFNYFIDSFEFLK
ncbi:MAG: hypothetical protein P0S95_01005 [Rhabdochlamydiaceae bacterium]|nr:hypothetical protein [Candidatus Amphrikana amoebophyrae]